jgi:uncharacterized protein YggE
MFRLSVQIAFVACLLAIALRAAAAGASKEPSLSASASVMVPLKPTALRMVLRLQTQDKTLKGALAKLKERRESAMKKLEALHPAKDSMKVVGPSIGADEGPLRAITSTTIAYKTPVPAPPTWAPPALPPAANPPPVAFPPSSIRPGPQPIVVFATLSAEWPLQGESSEKLLVEANELKRRVEAADLTDGKKAKRPDSDDESSEESEDAPSTYPSSPYPPPVIYRPADPASMPGVPVFRYVARVSAERRKAALADAVGKAKARAAELADAAGLRLAGLSWIRLAQVTSNRSWSDESFSSINMYEDETLDADPNKLRILVTVDVSYNVQP